MQPLPDGVTDERRVRQEFRVILRRCKERTNVFLARPLHRAALNRMVGGLAVWPETEFVVGAVQVLGFAMPHVPELSPAGPGERV